MNVFLYCLVYSGLSRTVHNFFCVLFSSVSFKVSIHNYIPVE